MTDLGADASASPAVSGLPGSMTKNAVEIALTPRASSVSATCPS
jgi:hypothetical protein